MKLTQADTQLGVTFSVVEFEEADIVSLIQDPTKLSRITDCVNADRRQKVALVDARFDLSESLKSLTPSGFARKTEQVKKDNELVDVPAETESQHIKRFIDGLVTGSFTTDGFHLPSGDDKVKEAAAYHFLQSLAAKCGDKEHDGKAAYVLNLDKAARQAGSGLVPKWAMDGAAQIIANGSQEKWAAKFTTGYTSGSGVAITPFPFEDFSVVAAHNATADEKAAVHETNKKRLAKCLVEQRRQENAARSGEFA